MGQLLSREDEEDYENQQSPEDDEVVQEKPKRRQRNTGPALRSRRTKPTGQGRTRRNRANPVTFDVNGY
jgi:hypothetical protein